VTTTKVPPPGEGPNDPALKEIDAVAFALDRVRAYLYWIEEHRASFEAARDTDPAVAEREMANLAHSAQEGRKYMDRLVELLLAGYTIDPSKQLPRDLVRLLDPDSGDRRGP
jgi:hypothetical protein